MTTAIIYSRFSPRRDAENCQSIEMQVEACTKYCLERGYTIGAVFSDPDVSGGEEDRPGFWNAIEAMKRGFVLVAYRSDRIARSVYLSEIVYREAAKKQARIEVVDGSRNGETPEDVLMRQVFSAFAEYERKIIAARTKAAMLRHMNNGVAIGKDPPYGKCEGEPLEITRDGKQVLQRRWVEEPAEQAVIVRIKSLKAEGLGLREIARKLNEDGVPCRGTNWSHTTIGRIAGRPRHEHEPY